jgi:hypothetical protein
MKFLASLFIATVLSKEAPVTVNDVNELLGNTTNAVKEVAATEDEMQQCSCSCCQVASRLPSERERTITGEIETHKCVHTEATAECPEFCMRPSKKDKKVFLSTRSKQLEYPRYCLQSCSPVLSMVGTSCASAANLTVAKAQASKFAEEIEASNEVAGGDWTPTLFYEEKRAAEEAAAAALAPAPAPAVDEAVVAEERRAEEQRMTIDLRDSLVARTKAEADAAVSRGLAIGERIKLHAHAADRSAMLLEKVGDVTKLQTESLEPDFLAAEESATKAGDLAAETYKTMQMAKAAVKNLNHNTEQLAMDAIKEAVTQEVKEEAESMGRRMSWSKPRNYRQVVTNNASKPYMQAVTEAAARVDEYTNAAEEMMQNARSMDVERHHLLEEMSHLTSKGDMLEATHVFRLAESLREQSEEVKANAQSYFDTAKSAKKIGAKWQSAAEQASAHAASVYDAVYTTTSGMPPLMRVAPPPSMVR